MPPLRILLLLALGAALGCGDGADDADAGDASAVADLAAGPDGAAAADLAGTDLASLDGDVDGALPPGNAAEGELCDGANRCMAGLDCVALSGTVSVCERLCASDATCMGTGSLCVLGGGTRCSIACGPVSNAGCPTGAACQVGVESGGAMRAFSTCEAAGSKTQGVTCDPAGHDCAAGYTCVDTGSSKICARYCAVGGGACATGSCTAFGSHPTIGGQEYGACL